MSDNDKAIETLCECCFNSVRNNETAQCSDRKHEHSFCYRCIRAYAKEELGKGNTEFKCMGSTTCEGKIAGCDRRLILGNELASSILKVEENNSFSQAGIEFYTCWNCKSKGQYLQEEDGSIFWCLECMEATCTLCGRDAHWDSRCSTDRKIERRTRKEEELTMQVVKSCKDCNRDIQKDGGCNKMTCVCGAAMCWLCGAKIPADNYDHFNESSSQCVNKLLSNVESSRRIRRDNRSPLRVDHDEFSYNVGYNMADHVVWGTQAAGLMHLNAVRLEARMAIIEARVVAAIGRPTTSQDFIEAGRLYDDLYDEVYGELPIPQSLPSYSTREENFR